MRGLYDKVSVKCSKLITRAYSTSFSLGIQMLNKKLRTPIYSIYGFVRLADEIVDTFHDKNKEELLNLFKTDTKKAINDGISLNPILNSFQLTVKEYNIKEDLIDAFLYSMELDLTKKQYSQEEYEKYIYGSAEVVGLMCLHIFCFGNTQLYDKLEFNAKKLGSAFQKINFLRDLKNDYKSMGRTYFPNINFDNFSNPIKLEIEKNIEVDFYDGLEGIKQLPKSSRFGVYIAYMYYHELLKKIKNTDADNILKTRIRISNFNKILILISSYFKHQFNLI